MKKTIFAGLTVLRPDESIQSDNGAFTGRDRIEIDRGIRLGAKAHRHTGEPGLIDPVVTPGATVVASGGAIQGGISLSIAYTLQDLAAGETLLSPLTTVSTPSPLAAPLVAPVGAFSSASGALMADTYTYALTYSDGEGGETPVGPSTTVTRPPGFASGQIALTDLNAGLEEADAAGWRLYRARGGGEYVLLATGGPGDSEFTDDGSVAADCDTHPPTDNINTTTQANQLQVTLPSGATIDSATFINLYGSLTGEFGESSLLGQYPVASAGAVVVFESFEPIEGQPPDVNRSYGGAPQIDPDTELLDWHWKRPVAASGLLGSGTLGDVRLVEDTGDLYAILSPLASALGPSEWTRLASAGGGGGGTPLVASGVETTVGAVDTLTLVASGAIDIALAEGAPGEAVFTLTGTGGGGGGDEGTDYGLLTVAELEAIEEPAKGETARVIAGAGRVWDLVADGDPEETGSPWAVLGGTPLFDQGFSYNPEAKNFEGEFKKLELAAELATPIAGRYLIEVSVELQAGSPQWNWHFSPRINGAAPSGATTYLCKFFSPESGTGVSNVPMYNEGYTEQALAKSDVVALYARAFTAESSPILQKSYITLTPVRIG